MRRFAQSFSGTKGVRPHVFAWAGRFVAAWGMLVGVAVCGFLAGLVFARCTHPFAAAPTWRYSLPEAPAASSTDYQTLFQEARSLVAEVMQSYCESPSAAAALGLLHYLAHDPEGEAKCWEQCLRLQPGHSLAYARLVALAEQRTDYGEVVQLMRKALAVEPRNVTYHGILGSALMHLNRPEEAKEVLESQLRMGPGTADTYLVLGKVYDQLKQLDRARQCLEQAVALEPSRADVLYSLGSVCAKLGDQAKTAEYLAQFDVLKSQNLKSEAEAGARHEIQDHLLVPARVAEILRLAALACLGSGDTALAEKCLLKAAAVSSTDPECRRMLARFYDTQGRLEDSLRYVQELKRIEPGNIEHHKSEGILYVRMNRFEEAERTFQEICRVAPQRGVGYAGLAELYLRADRKLAEARSLAEKAVQREPTAWNYVVLATLAAREGDSLTARAAQKRAVAIDPQYARYAQSDESLQAQK